MSELDLVRRIALLEKTLSDLLRVARAAERCDACVPPSEAFDGKHAAEWNRVVDSAYALLPPTS